MVNSKGSGRKRSWLNKRSILKGSDEGVMHFEESSFRTLSIVQHWMMKNVLKQDSSKSNKRNYPIIFPEGLRKTTKSFSPLQPVSGPRFESGTSRIRSRSVNH
jgi:hypothetical protein